MTSKSLFFKLMREDWKQRLWLLALVCLGFFFLFPVTISSLAREAQRYDNPVKVRAVFTDYVCNWVGVNNGWIVFFILVLSVLCAVTSFSYLNSKSKVDFYHSIPVRRGKLFFANYLNGILLSILPYTVFFAIGLVLGAAGGADMSKVFHEAPMGYVTHVVFFLINYSLAVTAVMMTGNRVIGLMGMLVLTFVLPMTVLLFYALPGVWFRTYYGTFFPQWVNFLSPFNAYIQFLNNYSLLRDYGEWTWHAAGVYLTCTFAASAVLTLVNLFLYQKRPSEAAGKAMAFEISKPVIRITLVVLSGLYMAVFGWSWSGESMGWTVFWLICGCVLCHCVVEIIYHFDFKKLFSHAIQLAVCLAVCLMAVFSLRYDWYGYDRYIPDGNEVKSSRIVFESLDRRWLNIIELHLTSEGYDKEVLGTDKYAMSHMNLEDTQTVLAVAQEAVAQTQVYRRNIGRNNTDQINQEWEAYQGEQKHTDILVEYTLNSGRKVRRIYSTINVAPVMDQMAAIYDADGYKQGIYQILGEEWQNAQLAGAMASWLGRPQREMRGPVVQELFHAYCQELAQLTLETRNQEVPVAMIGFITSEQENIYRLGNWDIDAMRPADKYEYSWYPVYPSFQNTLKLLKDQNMVTGTVPADSVIYMEAVREKPMEAAEDDTSTGSGPVYDIKATETFRAEITDPKQMEQLLTLCAWQRYFSQNWVRQWDHEYWIEISIPKIGEEDRIRRDEETYGTDDSTRFTFYFPEGQVPDFVKQAVDQ